MCNRSPGATTYNSNNFIVAVHLSYLVCTKKKRVVVIALFDSCNCDLRASSWRTPEYTYDATK
jgi:hypothetical protein